MIGQMRNKITLKEWGTAKEAGGGTTKTLASSFQVWAHIEARSGFIQNTNDQRQWPYDYKIKVRCDSRINEKLTIEHGTKELQINSLQVQEEGKENFFILRCSTL